MGPHVIKIETVLDKRIIIEFIQPLLYGTKSSYIPVTLKEQRRHGPVLPNLSEESIVWAIPGAEIEGRFTRDKGYTWERVVRASEFNVFHIHHFLGSDHLADIERQRRKGLEILPVGSFISEAYPSGARERYFEVPEYIVLKVPVLDEKRKYKEEEKIFPLRDCAHSSEVELDRLVDVCNDFKVIPDWLPIKKIQLKRTALPSLFKPTSNSCDHASTVPCDLGTSIPYETQLPILATWEMRICDPAGIWSLGDVFPYEIRAGKKVKYERNPWWFEPEIPNLDQGVDRLRDLVASGKCDYKELKCELERNFLAWINEVERSEYNYKLTNLLQFHSNYFLNDYWYQVMYPSLRKSCGDEAHYTDEWDPELPDTMTLKQFRQSAPCHILQGI